MTPEKAQSMVRTLLEDNFWLPQLAPNTIYERSHDDHDGTFFPKLRVIFDEQGDGWLGLSIIEPTAMPSTRFRTHGGGGSSLRVRNALLILAEAIRLDNEHRPYDEESAVKTAKEDVWFEPKYVHASAGDLLAFADAQERLVVARLFKRVCEERRMFGQAAHFRDIEHGKGAA